MIYVHFHDADWKEDEHPREKSGQFTSGGGSTGGSKAEGETEEKKDYIGTQAHMQELADSVMKQYGLHPVRVEMNDLGADHAIGVSGGRTHINLNSKFFTPENMAKYAKEWDGLTVGADKDDPQKTAAGIILHELGHVAMRQIQGESPEGTRRNKKVKEYDARWQEIEDLAREHWDRQHNGKGQGSPVSAYGQDNPAEFAAEAFVAQHLGTGAGWTAENRASGLPNAKAFWEAMFDKGVPAKAQHSWDAAWKEEEHNRGGDPANPGRFSKGGAAGLHAPKAEAPKRASAPSAASEGGSPDWVERLKKERIVIDPEMVKSEEHADTLINYTAGVSTVNSLLERDPKLSGIQEKADKYTVKEIGHLDDLTNSNYVQYGGDPLYRGVWNFEELIKGLEQGSTLDVPQFWSTSKKREVAEEFAEELGGEKGGLIKIDNSGPARPALDVNKALSHIGYNPNEEQDEVLFPRNSSYKVVKIDKANKIIHLKRLPKTAAAAPSEAPSEGAAQVRKPEGISAQMHKDLDDFGFRYEGVEPHTITEGGRDYTNEMVRYENPNGDTIKFKRGPDEEAIWWEAEFPNFHGPGKPYKTSGYGTVNWIGALPGTKEYRKAHKLKAAEREAYRETTVLSRVRTINQEKYPAHFHVIKQMSAKYDYPVEKFEVAEPDERFYSKVNGRAFMAAGWAEPKTGKIVINATVLQSLNQIIAHEILHQKQFAAERTDKAIKKYIDKNFDRLEADDGLTSYSRDWWANWQTVNKAFEGTYAQKNPDSKQIDAVRARAEYDHARWSAVGETLAEMASKKEGGAAQFTSSYEELYRMINRAYANTREGQREAA